MKATMRLGVFSWVLSFILITGFEVSHAATADTLRVAFVADARILDPATATRDYTGYASIRAIYDFLVQYARIPNPDGTVTVDTTQRLPVSPTVHKQPRSMYPCEANHD